MQVKLLKSVLFSEGNIVLNKGATLQLFKSAYNEHEWLASYNGNAVCSLSELVVSDSIKHSKALDNMLPTELIYNRIMLDRHFAIMPQANHASFDKWLTKLDTLENKLK